MKPNRQPFQPPQRATHLEVALDYATRGIAVVPCHHPVDMVGGTGTALQVSVCSCGRLHCPAPALHPIGLVSAADATTEPVDIVCWWVAAPEAGIATPAGVSVDVATVKIETDTRYIEN